MQISFSYDSTPHFLHLCILIAYLYTGKERDAESGLDNFEARYYGSTMGRFMSPDPSGLVYADPRNPQSLNLYSYVMNNPLMNIDPTGLACVHINNDTGAYEGFESGDCDNSTEEKANSGYYFNGTVGTIYTSTGDASGQVTGIGGTGDDGTYLINSNPAGLPPTQSDNPQGNMFDMSQDERIQQLSTGVTADTQHSVGCIAQAFGIGGGGNAVAGAVGRPNPTLKRFAARGASQGTSQISKGLSNLANKAGIPRGQYPSPTGGLFADGQPFVMRTTGNLGRAAGRWAPYAVSAASTAYASYQLFNCLGK